MHLYRYRDVAIKRSKFKNNFQSAMPIYIKKHDFVENYMLLVFLLIAIKSNFRYTSLRA